MKRIFGVALLLGVGVLMAFTVPGVEAEQHQTLKQENSGIKFTDLSYDDALKLSETTGKPIFIDCYTVWCGPCKMLDARTFSNKEVGDFFNENFINLKVEMEKDEDGPRLARTFSVRGYPTLLFVNGEGKLVKQSVGFVSADQLLAVAKGVVK